VETRTGWTMKKGKIYLVWIGGFWKKKGLQNLLVSEWWWRKGKEKRKIKITNYFMDPPSTEAAIKVTHHKKVRPTS